MRIGCKSANAVTNQPCADTGTNTRLRYRPLGSVVVLFEDMRHRLSHAHAPRVERARSQQV